MASLIYFAQTYDSNNKKIEVNIYKENFGGTPHEMILAGEKPVTIEYDYNNDIFKPLVQSRCVINVVTKEPYLDLYTGKTNEIICTVTVEGTMSWFGYLTPNIYNSDYEIGYNELSLEFIDIIAQLDNVKFSRVNYYSTFYEIIKRGLKKLDTSNMLGSIYDQYTTDTLFINNIGCLERNYVDETGSDDDGAMTYKEVFESIMRYLGKSMLFYNNNIYMFDVTNTASSARKYDIDSDSATRSTITRTTVGLDNSTDYLGVANSNCTISLGDVYNKITLIANNNPIENVIPDIFDSSKFQSIMPDGEMYIQMSITDYINSTTRAGLVEIPSEDKQCMMLNAFFKNDDWNMSGSTYTITIATPDGFDAGVSYSQVKEVSTYIDDSGVFKWKYTDNGGVEHLLNITVDSSGAGIYYVWYREGSNGNLFVNAAFSDPAHTNYIGGQTITLQIPTGTGLGFNRIDYGWTNPYPNKISKDNISHLTDGIFLQRYTDWKVDYGQPASISWTSCLTMQKVGAIIGMSANYNPTFNESSVPHLDLLASTDFVGFGGYFIISMEYMFSNILNHANTSPFRFTSEKYGTALKYANTDNSAKWSETGEIPAISNGLPANGVFRDDMFYTSLKVGNLYYNGEEWTAQESKFVLRHRNKDGDTIFGVSKKIDNTVSWEWNLADSSEGYAIPLPKNHMLSGKIEFKLWADSRLGGAAQYPKCGIIEEHGDSKKYDSYNKFDGDQVCNASPILAINISDLKLIYTTADTVEDIYNLQEYDADVLYTNVIDNEFVTKMDDIKLTTNTYTPHATSFSYVLKQNDDGSFEYITNTLNSTNQENNIVEKYVNFYSSPKLIYSNNLNSRYYKKTSPNTKSAFSPLCLLSLNNITSKLAPISLNYDLKTSTMEASFIEIQ